MLRLTTPKRERVVEANRVLHAISRHGRRFFYSEQHNRVSQFELDVRGHIWLRDRWTDRLVYVAWRGRWRHFSEGGTLRALCEALINYIRTGKPISCRWFGPWPDYVCDGDLWGYGAEAWEKLRPELYALPAVDATRRALEESGNAIRRTMP